MATQKTAASDLAVGGAEEPWGDAELAEVRAELEADVARVRAELDELAINILARQREPPPPVTILTPEALRLRHAPLADCTRYDSLRRGP